MKPIFDKITLMPLAYRIIFIITLLMTVMRYFLVPQWNITHHIVSFFFQAAVLSFLWWMLDGINKHFEKVLPFNDSVFKRLLIQILVTLIISFPILFVVDYLSELFFPHLPFMNQQFKAVVVVLFITVILFIDFVFYGTYFFRQWRKSVVEKAWLQVQTAEAEKERSLVQYQHLKNQVNPHFLFNTLTSLDGLILTDPQLASTFVRHLSKVYRYVLEHSENEVVSVEAEINFINHYISVLDIRYGEALKIDIDISKEAMDRGIVMVTLQMLIDNAIKHNVVHSNEPLSVKIKDEGQFLVVTNNKQPRKQIEVSTKKGIKHLQQLYGYLSPTAVEISDAEDIFQVKLPLL